jgi:hypothetical protein
VRVLSVDLGTSNTVAVLSAHGRAPRVVEVDGSATMPSAVFAGENGQLIVGREAERRARLDPSRFEPNPKRRIDEGTLLLGDRVLPVTDVLAAVLGRVAQETSRQLAGDRPDEVRLTHPAQWGPVRRNALLSAARQAGMGTNLVLIPEPVAAAAHFASFSTGGKPPDPRGGSAPTSLALGQALAVYDLGAGTFDVAVVAATQTGFAVLAEAGLPDLGGLDVDQALLEHVGRHAGLRDAPGWQRLLRPESTGDRRAQRALREDVKAAKESLSTHPQTEVALPEPFEDVLVTRAELEALIRPSLLRSVELMAGTIRSTGFGPDRLVGIYLVGGSSRIPLVATLISHGMRIVPTNLDQPETAVALGAHHVSREGASLRTGDLSGPVMVPSQPVRVQVPARPPAPPVQPRYQPGPPPPGYPAPYPPPRSSSKKPLLIGLVVLVVAALGVAGTIFLLSDKGGGGGAAADNPCAGQQPDGKGLTPCMRELAGSVPSRGQCESTTKADAPGGIRGAKCVFPDKYEVSYYQVGSMRDVETQVNQFQSTKSGSPSTKDWSGGGVSGKVYINDMGNGLGALMFTLNGRSVFGSIFTPFPESTTQQPQRQDVASYFDQNVKPGSA